MKTSTGSASKSTSMSLIESASVALIPVQARNITYVFSLISEQPRMICLISSLSKASLFLLIIRASLTLRWNFDAETSMPSCDSSKFFATFTLCRTVRVVIGVL